jgi:hypothetical protein
MGGVLKKNVGALQKAIMKTNEELKTLQQNVKDM